MIKRALYLLPGILILLTGLFAVFGWLTQTPLFLHPGHTTTPITFGGSICFCLAGGGLICFSFSSQVARYIQFICGCLLVLIAALTLAEFIFHIDLAIDQMVDTSWIVSNTLYPGRIAFNSAIGFYLTGLVFVLFPFASRKPAALLIELCIFLLFIIGTLSVLGYFFKIEFLYSWTYTSMSLYSSITFTLLGICLWYFWRQSIYCYELYRGKEDKKLIWFGSILLLSIILIVEFASFASLSDNHESLIQNMKHAFPAILFIACVGFILLRMEVIPLIKRMVAAEKDLNKTNARLKKSEERYALAVRGSNAGLWDWEVGTDNIFYSPYLKNMIGYTEAELENNVHSFFELLHPDDLGKASNAMREHILHRVPYNVEFRLKRKSGEYHWFQALGQARWDEHGRATRVAGSISDITERKINERRLLMQYAVTQTLSQAENMYDAVSDVTHIICNGLEWDYGAIWLVDHERNKLEYVGSWHQENAHATDFMETRKKIEFTPGKGVIGRVWSTGKPYWSSDITNDKHFLQSDAAKKARLNSGFCFPMILQSDVFGVMEFFSREIESPDEKLLQMMAAIGPQISQFMQRKFVEQELRESEAHNSAILNSATDGIITITETGSIVSFNLQTEKMFGFSETELKEKDIDRLIPGVTTRVSEIANKRPFEFTAVEKNGNHFPTEVAVSGMQMDQKNIFVMIVRDITERKKVEQLKNEFVSVVSHELRTPLTSIRGSLGLILGGVVGSFSDKAKNLLDIANNNCERLLHLINDILDTEKMESGKMIFHLSQIDIAKIVKNSIVSNQMYGEKFGVKIRMIESVSDVLVNVDPDRMLQVMANLISNAVKFSKQGDTVDISIRVLNQKVRISVTDYGAGIPLEFQSKVFQKFSQADTTTTRGKGGTGLGLNITRSIIEKFGGTIDFVSEPDKKTVFHVYLPVCGEESNIDVSDDKIIEASEKKSLLVCEDDEDQAQYIKAMLESAGFEVDTALTASEARQLIIKKDYQGLLLDLILPDQDGISFIRELRANPKTKNLPIIVMSVIAKTGHSLLNGDAFTVLDWLDKPIDFSKLLKNVSTLTRKHDHTPTVLHIEDDEDARNIIKSLLQDVANVACATTLQEAKIKLMNEKFDLVILDLLLPDGKGTELLPLLAKSETPVIVFSATELDSEHAAFVNDALVKSETSHEKLFSKIEKIIHT